MEITWRVINGEGKDGVGKLQGIRSIIGQYKIDRGDYTKNSIGNVEAKELICMTHRHELKVGNVGGRGCAG